MKVIVCAGGTGGHVFPALALCEQLTALGRSSMLLTDDRGARFCNNARVKYQSMPKISFKAKSIFSSLLNALRIIVALRIAWKNNRPEAVVGFGGLMTVLPLLLARAMGIPAIVHEQNSILGRANTFLSTFGVKVTSNFTSNMIGVENIATPVRPEIQKKAAAIYTPLHDDKFVITVIAGSQGAASFADILSTAVSVLPISVRKKLAIVQQVASDQIELLSKTYEHLGIQHKLVEFITDIAFILERSSLVICRSGASTLSELMTVGRPAILIPYTHATNDHQKRNAEYLENAGAAWVINEDSSAPSKLAVKIEDFVYAKDQLALAAINMLRCRRPQANTELATYIVSSIEGEKE